MKNEFLKYFNNNDFNSFIIEIYFYVIPLVLFLGIVINIINKIKEREDKKTFKNEIDESLTEIKKDIELIRGDNKVKIKADIDAFKKKLNLEGDKIRKFYFLEIEEQQKLITSSKKLREENKDMREENNKLSAILKRKENKINKLENRIKELIYDI